MADHQANSEEQNPTGAVPGGENPAAQTDDKAQDGLKADLVKHRQRASEAESKVAELQKQLETLMGQADAGSQQPPQPSSDIADRLAAIERQNALGRLQAEMGLTGDQAQKVHEIAAESGLSEAEARQVAALREPDLFAEGTGSGYDPAVHGSSRPMPGSVPPMQDERSAYEQQLEGAASYMATQGEASFDKRFARRIQNNLVGHIAHKQAGRKGEHKLIPLPKRKQ